jgi:hypothetical protein
MDEKYDLLNLQLRLLNAGFITCSSLDASTYDETRCSGRIVGDHKIGVVH